MKIQTDNFNSKRCIIFIENLEYISNQQKSTSVKKGCRKSIKTPKFGAVGISEKKNCHP